MQLTLTIDLYRFMFPKHPLQSLHEDLLQSHLHCTTDIACPVPFLNNLRCTYLCVQVSLGAWRGMG